MTAIYTYSEARQNLASLLDLAVAEGEVRIRRREGPIFTVRLEPVLKSPLSKPKYVFRNKVSTPRAYSELAKTDELLWEIPHKRPDQRTLLTHLFGLQAVLPVVHTDSL